MEKADKISQNHMEKADKSCRQRKRLRDYVTMHKRSKVLSLLFFCPLIRHSEPKAKNLHEFDGILSCVQSVTSLSYKRDSWIRFSLYVSQIPWICVTVLSRIISTRTFGEISDTLISCKRDRYM